MTTKLCILHTNDTHSYLDDFGKRAYLIKSIRQENQQAQAGTLLVDSGDVLTGNIYFNLYKGQREALLLNLLAYDAMTLGNHEFDEGSVTLARFLETLEVPLITSNIDVADDPYLNPFLGTKILPYLFKRLNVNTNVAIFGMTTPQTLDNASPSDETHFHDPTETAIAMVEKLKQMGATSIILLSHLGYQADLALAEAVSGIDLILGGHSHHYLHEPTRIGQTAILQAGSFGKHLGRADLEFDDSGRVSKIDGCLIDIEAETDEEPQVKALVDDAKSDKKKYYSRTIADAEVELVGRRADLQKGETNLSKLVTNAYLKKARDLGYPVQISIINGMGIRTSILPGPISYGDIYKVLPFGCCLSMFELTGKEIKDTIECGFYPQTSGLLGVLDKRRPKAQVCGLRLLDGTPICDDDTYLVATNTYVGSGRDQYVGFRTGRLLADNLELDLQLFSDYLVSLPQPITYLTPDDLITKV